MSTAGTAGAAALSERDAWICLASVSGIADELTGLLLGQFRSAANVLSGALDGTLEAWNLMFGRRAGRVPLDAATMAGLKSVAREPSTKLDALRELGLWTVTSLDADFPPRLRDLDPPPAVIHGLGERTLLDSPRAVALVGTRRPSPAGRLLAAQVAGRMVECRAVVVSGLAIGIDGAAHAAVVERGGATIGVIGGGHRHPGPRAHERLRHEIAAAGGAIVSEHHPDTRPTRGTYPRRNRIIAALGDATVVVEAPRTSGALITAKRALELGRPVFVAPGRVGDRATAGSLALLRDTPARIVAGLDELVEDLGYLETVPSSRGEGEVQPGGAMPALAMPALAMLGAAERAVAERLRDGPAGLDVLVAETGLSPGAASSAVTLLLMRGWVRSVGPAYIVAGPLAR